MRLFYLLMLSQFLWGCDKDEQAIPEPCVPDNYLYYSDYFVFVADDETDPLVIPMDVNWTPSASGYNSEFKGWYGTEAEWPIGYFLNDSVADLCLIPQEAWEHADNSYFQFNASTREIISTIWEAPELRLTIPESDNWIQTPIADRKAIYGCRTTATVDGTTRNGWLIYERIRQSSEEVEFGDFEAFFWIPIIVDDVYYHFEQHRGEQIASKWTKNADGTIDVATLSAYELEILGTSTDPVSGRTNIPDTLQVTAPEWGLNIKLASGGSQVGHGPMFPNGLAYYRQSIVTSTPDSEDVGYGMLELILEDD